MLVLAFDTTGPQGSAALFRAPEVVADVGCDGGSNYSIALFEMVDRLLGQAGVSLAEVEIFAAATGPGSFTGIRVGLAAAQAWARVFGKPACGVSILEAMVGAARPQGSVVIPVVDAHRSEFYLGVFRRDSPAEDVVPQVRLTGEQQTLNCQSIAALVEELAQTGTRDVTFINRERDEAALALSTQLPGWLAWTAVPSHLAIPIARLAVRASQRAMLQTRDELDALYIRRSDAEINWRGGN